jgi:hypothetical protein
LSAVLFLLLWPLAFPVTLLLSRRALGRAFKRSSGAAAYGPSEFHIAFHTKDDGRTWFCGPTPVECSPLSDLLQNAYSNAHDGFPVETDPERKSWLMSHGFAGGLKKAGS